MLLSVSVALEQTFRGRLHDIDFRNGKLARCGKLMLVDRCGWLAASVQTGVWLERDHGGWLGTVSALTLKL